MVNSGPTIFMTGAAGVGIGNHLCKVFHERGFRVIATARKVDALEDLAKLGIETVALDVNNEESIQAAFRQVKELLGENKGLDYLYQNAGVNYTVPATDLTIADVRHTFETNLFSVMRITEIFLPLLLLSKGTIVATGSVAGIMPFWFGSAYNASKAALKSYLDTMRVELAPFDVHVVNVITAGVRSNIARTDRQLPPDSIFQPYRDLYEKRLVRSQTEGMDTRRYAEEVAGKVANARGWVWNSNEVWAGGKWRLIWVMASLDWWWPGGTWGPFLKRVEGLRKR